MTSPDPLQLDYTQRILLDRPDLLVIDKPAGLETLVTGGGNTRFCLRSILRRRLNLPRLEMVHRLDRDTTGCLLVSRDGVNAEALEDLFRHRSVRKEYLALCAGVPRPATGVLNKALSRWEGGRTPVKVVASGGQPAQTDYKLLAHAPAPLLSQRALSLILFRPHTGRTHQIRVHAAFLGCPILGDDQYGDRPTNRIVQQALGLDRQALHAWRLELTPPPLKQSIRVTAPLPADMRAILEAWLPKGLSAVLG